VDFTFKDVVLKLNAVQLNTGYGKNSSN